MKDLPSPSADTRHRAFDVATRLASKDVTNVTTRWSAVTSLVECDPASAKVELGKLTKDHDATIADGAKQKLVDLAKPKK